ncbi:uncharacterized protein [Nicotiana sylvestris]|uniref:uncharacterized protein n=1 Tax=Nicotiana sylvestris TaxID=4096 RepID=UPI00388C7CE5
MGLNPMNQSIAKNAADGSFMDNTFARVTQILDKMAQHNQAWHSEDTKYGISYGSPSLTNMIKENQERDQVIAGLATNVNVLTKMFTESQTKKLSVNIPFVEAFQEMPGFAKYLKDLITKKRTTKNEVVNVTHRVSSIIATSTVQNKEDLGAFTIPCTIGTHDFARALCDNGASINLMPFDIYKQAGLVMLRPTSMRLQMSDCSIKRSVGIVDDVLVKVGKFHLPTDFVILDCVVDKEIPIILGRPFLATERALMDLEQNEIKFHVNDEEVTFQESKGMKLPHEYESILVIDVVDEVSAEICKHKIQLENEAKPSEGHSIAFLMDILAKSTLRWRTKRRQHSLDLMELLPLAGCRLVTLLSIVLTILDKCSKDVRRPTLCLTRRNAISWWMKELYWGIKFQNMEQRLTGQRSRSFPNFLHLLQLKVSKVSWGMPDFIGVSSRVFPRLQIPCANSLRKMQNVFDEKCLKAFEELKQKLIPTPIIVTPDWSLPLELMCNASGVAIGEVLGQRHNKVLHPVYYASKTLNGAQMNYMVSEQELLTIVYAFEKFRAYLLGSKVIVYTDHAALRYLMAKKDANPMLIR